MTFLLHWLPHIGLIWATWLTYVCLIAGCFVRHKSSLHLLSQLPRLPIVIALFALLWALNVRVEAGQLAGMSYHLLGLNLISLMLGTPMALLLGSGILLLFGIAQQSSGFVAPFALNALCVVVPACLLNALIRQQLLCRLPKNVFIYIFCAGFLSGAFGMLLTGLLVCSVLYFADVLSNAIIWQQAFPIFFLLAWGEAFLSGIGAAVCVAFKPEQLATFDDAVYLRQPTNRIWDKE